MENYQVWMQTYQQFFTRIISKEIAQQWLYQAEMILQTIKKNVKMLQEQKYNKNQ